MHILIHHAEVIDLHGSICWAMHKEIQADDGTVKHLLHVCHLDMFETIAAELDIDPDDWDTLLDIELYRSELPHYDDHADGAWLFDAPTVADARELHLARIADVKGDGRARGVPGVAPENRRVAPQANPPILDSGDEDPLEVIKRHSPMSKPHMSVKREHRDKHREGAHIRRMAKDNGRRAAPGGIPERLNPDQLRAHLAGPVSEPRTSDLPSQNVTN
jgi:hypothetical protein